jgi:hypothetical protein
MIEDETLLTNPAVYPEEEILSRCSVFKYLGSDGDALYDQYWTKVNSAAAN